MAGYSDYDYVSVVSAGTGDTYSFYKGTSGGALVGQIAIIYSGTDKTVTTKVFFT